MPNPTRDLTKATTYQTVRIHLADGRVAEFTGPAQLTDADLTVGVRRVEFTEPRPLPKDCSFGLMEEADDGC